MLVRIKTLDELIENTNSNLVDQGIEIVGEGTFTHKMNEGLPENRMITVRLEKGQLLSEIGDSTYVITESMFDQVITNPFKHLIDLSDLTSKFYFKVPHEYVKCGPTMIDPSNCMVIVEELRHIFCIPDLVKKFREELKENTARLNKAKSNKDTTEERLRYLETKRQVSAYMLNSLNNLEHHMFRTPFEEFLAMNKIGLVRYER